MAGQLGVTHMLAFARTEAGVNLRVARVPHGPTLTFRVVNYSLAKDVLASQRRPKSPGNEFMNAPLVSFIMCAYGEAGIQSLAGPLTPQDCCMLAGDEQLQWRGKADEAHDRHVPESVCPDQRPDGKSLTE